MYTSIQSWHSFYFHDNIQAKPLQSRILHIRALCSGLFHLKRNLIYVLDALHRFDDTEWALYEDKNCSRIDYRNSHSGDGLIMCYSTVYFVLHHGFPTTISQQYIQAHAMRTSGNTTIHIYQDQVHLIYKVSVILQSILATANFHESSAIV
jgi:hypothetical protein